MPTRTTHLAIVAATLLTGLAGTAGAATFSATADVINSAGDPRASASTASIEPVSTTVGPISSRDGKRLGEATASALRGSLQAIGLSSSVSGKVTSIGQASATWDDVLFVFAQPGPATGFLPSATLNYSLNVGQSISGPALAGLNPRDVTFAMSFAGASDGGFVDFQGGRGLDLLGARTLTATNVPVGTPVTITFSLFAGAAAASGGSGLVQAAINAILQVGAAQQPAGAAVPQGAATGARSVLSAPPSDSESFLALGADAQTFPRVFDLPEGVTVFSESMGIVDNRWVAQPIPEPSTWALWLAGAAVLAWPLRRRARQTA